MKQLCFPERRWPRRVIFRHLPERRCLIFKKENFLFILINGTSFRKMSKIYTSWPTSFRRLSGKHKCFMHFAEIRCPGHAFSQRLSGKLWYFTHFAEIRCPGYAFSQRLSGKLWYCIHFAIIRCPLWARSSNTRLDNEQAVWLLGTSYAVFCCRFVLAVLLARACFLMGPLDP
jgi:hypothetical protein